MLISEIEPGFSTLVINSILSVFLGSAAVLTGFLVLCSDKHSRRTNVRLGTLVAAGVLLFSGGMTGWNIGSTEMHTASDARFAELLTERFDATAGTSYTEMKTALAAGDTGIVLTSAGIDVPVMVRRVGGVLHFVSRSGTEFTPVSALGGR